MARSDLLISLVKASVSGDSKGAKVTSEAIIAEERAKKHNVLADRLSRALQANGNGHATVAFVGNATPRHREFLVELSPRRRLEDLVLTELTRRACDELIEEQHRASVLRAHSLEPRHRVLLAGPPGNGKTSLAEALAESLAVPFFIVRYEAMIGSFLGETASRLKRVFDYARTTPCVLFFDEFDAVGKERGDVHETGEIKRVVTSLLMQIDDLPSYTVVVAATNHAELLDRAVWRRFQVRLQLKAPTERELAAYFKRFADSCQEPLGQSPATLAKKLGAISYGEAEEFCRDVRRRAALSLGERPLKVVVSERLQLWGDRLAAPQWREVSDGGISAAPDPAAQA
jgi:SpoVK/Ycf46/Vps4 family AAA+-type ATPase